MITDWRRSFRADDVDMDARFLEILRGLFRVSFCLLPNDLLIFQGFFPVDTKEFSVGGGVGIDFLVNDAEDALQDIAHCSFAFPVLAFEEGHADESAFVDVDVLELGLELYAWGALGVVVGEGDLNGKESSFPEGVPVAGHPEYPAIVAFHPLGHALDHLHEVELSDALEFILDSCLSHVVRIIYFRERLRRGGCISFCVWRAE